MRNGNFSLNNSFERSVIGPYLRLDEQERKRYCNVEEISRMISGQTQNDSRTLKVKVVSYSFKFLKAVPSNKTGKLPFQAVFPFLMRFMYRAWPPSIPKPFRSQKKSFSTPTFYV